MNLILDWAETWALLIPIIVFWMHREQPRYMWPVIIYLHVALVINASADTIAHFALKYHPDPTQWWYSNTRFYNVHNLIRFFFFTAFFYQHRSVRVKWIKMVVVLFIAGAIAMEMLSRDSIWSRTSINSSLHTIEALLLLVLCLFSYFSLIESGSDVLTSDKGFLQVTAIALYAVGNFFVFLFYNPLLRVSEAATYNLWAFYNVAFVISCTFTARALYVSDRHSHTA